MNKRATKSTFVLLESNEPQSNEDDHQTKAETTFLCCNFHKEMGFFAKYLIQARFDKRGLLLSFVYFGIENSQLCLIILQNFLFAGF